MYTGLDAAPFQQDVVLMTQQALKHVLQSSAATAALALHLCVWQAASSNADSAPAHRFCHDDHDVVVACSVKLATTNSPVHIMLVSAIWLGQSTVLGPSTPGPSRTACNSMCGSTAADVGAVWVGWPYESCRAVWSNAPVLESELRGHSEACSSAFAMAAQPGHRCMARQNKARCAAATFSTEVQEMC